jgi:glycosyltransferase involved in cell wall biosynthesis
LSEISRDEHARLMREAAVYLLALREAEVSSGHVRLLDATVAGTAVAASAVRGLADYVNPDRTAVVFPPGDAAAARAAINRLLESPPLRRKLAEGAREAARGWTRDDYLRSIHQFVLDASVRS